MSAELTRIKFSTPIDWIILTARWFFFLAVIIWIIFTDSPSVIGFGLLILMGIVYVVEMVLLAAGRVGWQFRITTTILDFLIAQAWLLVSLGMGRELIWLGILPLISASFYFQWLGSLLVILSNALLLVLLLFQITSLEDVLLRVGITLPVSILLGLGLVYLSIRWKTNKEFWKPVKNTEEPGASQTEQGKRQTLFAMISELSATLNHQKALETSLNLASAAMAELGGGVGEFTSAVILFSGGDGDSPMLRIAACRRFNPGDMSVGFPGNRGALAQVINDGNALLSKDPMLDPELSRISALKYCHSALLLPLRMGLDTYGLLLFAHIDPDYFTNDRWEVLEILRNQTSIAIQNSLLYQQLELERNRLLEIQDESRRKLARDLHDGPTQAISAIAMRVNYARRLMDRDLKGTAEELYKIEDIARKTTKEIRHMLFTLRPLVLESQGLEAALDSMAEKMNETYGQNVSIQAEKRLVELLETGKQAVIFYIAEEAVNNARKHAQADHIWVRLKMIGEGLGHLEVEDDGKGFDVAAVDATYASRGSLGMINLRERAEHINGVFQIDSGVGHGTRVRVTIPLTEEATDRLRRGS